MSTAQRTVSEFSEAEKRWLFIGCLLVVMPLVRIVIPGYPQALAASIWDVRQLMAAQEKDGQSRLKKLQKVREAKGCHDVS